MNIQHWGGTPQSNVNASATAFFNAFNGVDYDSSAEVRNKTRFTVGGVISLVGLFLSSNDRGDSTWRLRKNSANGNAVITLTAGGSPGQFEDAVNNDTFSDNDYANYQLVAGAGGTTLVVGGHWHTFAPSSGTVALISSSMSAGFNITNDCFFSLVRPAANNQTEANEQNTIHAPGTLANAFVYIPTNGRSDQVDWRIRKNGANGNIICTYAAAATGEVEDLTNNDSIAAGDEVNWMFDQNGGTGTMANQKVFKVEFTATGSAFPLLAAGGGTNQNSGLTHYHPASGALHYGETVEGNSQLKSNVTFAWSNLTGYVSAHTLNASAPLTLRARVNGANGNQTIAFTGTGQVTDAVNNDAITAGDELSVSSVTGGTSGSVGLRTISSLASGAAGQSLSWLPQTAVAQGPTVTWIPSGMTP